MSGATWADEADRVLKAVFRDLPEGATEAEVRTAVRAAYPFGERAMWPYKAWLARVKVWRDAWRKGYRLPSPRVDVSHARPPRDRHELDHATLEIFAEQQPVRCSGDAWGNP